VGEVPSQRLRARTAGLAVGISVLFGLAFNTALPVISRSICLPVSRIPQQHTNLSTSSTVDTEGANWGYNTAWLFFGTGAVFCVLVWLYVPEPSRRNYAEMDEMYRKRVPARKMRKYVTEVQIAQQDRHLQMVEKLQA
jgi:SP family sugar:H+ symporter-like MFS transporter